MKKYKTLKSIFHQHDAQTALEEAQVRRGAGYAVPIRLGEHEIFYIPTTQLTLLVEKIYLNEQTIHKLAGGIPGVAQRNYLYSLIVDEITSTNEIEGVRSTRQEILDALESTPKENKRFREIALLYLSLIEEHYQVPRSLEEIRSSYDELMRGELADQDQLDGRLFRANPVYVKDGSGQAIHAGATSEAQIVENLEAMIAHLLDPDVPQLFASVAGHLLLEITHPFYDGNGRFGRYLLSAQLKKMLSAPTVLTLSSKINEEKSKYYKAFTTVEDPHNYADATPFLIALLELIAAAQEDLMNDFENKNRSMQSLQSRIAELKEEKYWDDRNVFMALFIFGQVGLFGNEAGISWEELSIAVDKSRNTTRRYIDALEQENLLTRISARPLKHKLSDKGLDFLGLPRA